jgi:hypothetical protein
MRRSPAEFARVKVRFPQWYIQRTLPGAAVPGYTAVEMATGRRIWCASLAELESRLQETHHGLAGGPQSDHRVVGAVRLPACGRCPRRVRRGRASGRLLRGSACCRRVW